MTFANRLRKLRRDRNLTLSEVAIAIGVPTSTYRDWEYGKAIRNIEAYERIAKFFGLSLDELISGRAPENNDVLKYLLKAQESIELAIKTAKSL
jgi:transcriptional regulator with XRE-family HTH domain